MVRTLRTARLTFRQWLPSTPVQVWPDLREAHDAPCNIGFGRKKLEAKFPELDFSECPDKWDYPPHNPEDATARAERVRKRLKALACSGDYQNIYVVSHRGFVAFLVEGDRFDVCGKIELFCFALRWLTDQALQNFGHSVSRQTMKSKV